MPSKNMLSIRTWSWKYSKWRNGVAAQPRFVCTTGAVCAENGSEPTITLGSRPRISNIPTTKAVLRMPLCAASAWESAVAKTAKALKTRCAQVIW